MKSDKNPRKHDHDDDDNTPAPIKIIPRDGTPPPPDQPPKV